MAFLEYNLVDFALKLELESYSREGVFLDFFFRVVGLRSFETYAKTGSTVLSV